MADKWHDSDRHWSNFFTLDQSQRVLESRADTSDYILSYVLVLTVIVYFVSITRSLRMPSQQYSMRSPAVKRLMKEAQELHEPNELYHAQPLEDNLFEWHFTIRGPGDSEFGGGIYHGRIILPPDYPMKPPSVILLTPNGRFEVYKKICLSISGHHPESWQPSWSIRTALLAIIGFMPTHGNGAIGSLDYKPEERKKLAKKSTEFKCPSCGLIKDLLLPETEASKAASEEAKELAAQIDFQAEKKGSTSQASNSADSSSSDGSKQDTTQPSSNPQTTQASPFNMSQFNPMMFAMPGMIPRPNTSSGSTSPSQIPPPPYFNPMLMRPPGGMQLPPGITQMPQGFPQLPQGFPQMPQGFPQMPQGFPQMPQGFPPMPQGFPPRFWMNQPTAAATGTSEQTLQGITSQSLTSAAVTSTSTANSVQPSSSLSSPSSRESPVPTVSPVTSQNLTSQASQSRSTVSSPSLSSPAAAAAPCPSSATSKASSMATATSTTDSGASIEASETSTSATGPSPSLASSPNTSSSPASGLRHRQSSNTPSRTQSSAGTRQPTTQRPPQSNGNTTFVLTVVVALAIALLIFRRLLYMNVFDYAFSEPEH